MKKKLTAIGLFVLAFAGTYLALSFGVPELAKPVITDADHFFAESLLHLMGVKLLISVLIAAFLACAPWSPLKSRK